MYTYKRVYNGRESKRGTPKYLPEMNSCFFFFF